MFPAGQYDGSLCPAEAEMLNHLAGKLVRGVYPIVFVLALWTPGPVAGKSIKPFSFWFKEKRIVARGKYLNIVAGGKSIDSMGTKG